MKTILKISALSKRYKSPNQQINALADINISVSSGEFVCVIGPNGSGKSTLLKIIAGISAPSKGDIEVPDKVVYLPQQPSLLPWRTVIGNLALPSEITKSPNKAARNKAMKLLKDFKLDKFANFYPDALSGGMQQKVSLLRTILTEPEVMLLDEPFSALDAITRLELQDWLLSLWQQTKPAVICVTHDIDEAIFLADTIYVLSSRPGRIKQKIRVDLPRPRTREQLISSSSEKLNGQLYKLLVSAS